LPRIKSKVILPAKKEMAANALPEIIIGRTAKPTGDVGRWACLLTLVHDDNVGAVYGKLFAVGELNNYFVAEIASDISFGEATVWGD
jgi:hypothetical protein